ncbi:MAG: SMR family transporter [Candidatus Azambacteria bacterium]|nr:SMR family transporter [Candidatus Azambacteria bacterium]
MSSIIAKYIFLFLITLAVALEVAADVLFKKWTLEHRSYLLVVGLVIYMVGTTSWAYSLRYGDLSRAISIFAVLNLIILVLVGVLFFKEDLSLINKIGIAFGVISVILLEI